MFLLSASLRESRILSNMSTTTISTQRPQLGTSRDISQKRFHILGTLSEKTSVRNCANPVETCESER